jgi:hypothetical protein
MGGEKSVPTPAELREESRQYRQAAKKETTPEISRRLALHALALAQLAEKIEREEPSKPNSGQATD